MIFFKIKLPILQKTYFAFIFASTFLISLNTLASSCCGGGSSSSMIITGDNQAEMSVGYSFRNDLGQTDNEGWSYFNNSKTLDQRTALNIQAQYQISEHTQIGSKVSLVEKSLQKSGLKENETGLSDIDLQISYEYLPEYTYSPIKPRGFIYSKLSIPTSRSLYDSNSNIMTDVRGSGVYSLTFGQFLIKRIDAYSLKLSTEWSHYFQKNFNGMTLHNYEKFIIPFGASYTFKNSDFSIGATQTFSYQTNKTISGKINSKSAQEYFWELSTFINYSPNRTDLYSLSYSDSTLIGKNINSPLYRSVALTYTYALPL